MYFLFSSSRLAVELSSGDDSLVGDLISDKALILERRNLVKSLTKLLPTSEVVSLPLNSEFGFGIKSLSLRSIRLDTILVYCCQNEARDFVKSP